MANWISAIANLLSSLCFLTSLIFIWRQIRGLRQQLRNSAVHGYWSVWIEIDKWFVTNTALKPYFYHAKDVDEATPDELRLQLDSTAELLLDCYADMYHQREVMSPEEEFVFQNFMRNSYHYQPFFHRFVEEHRRWYSPNFVEYLTAAPARLVPPSPARSFPLKPAPKVALEKNGSEKGP